MRRSGTGSGGGYRMNKHRDVRAPKAEPRPRAINPVLSRNWARTLVTIPLIALVAQVIAASHLFVAAVIHHLSAQPTTSKR